MYFTSNHDENSWNGTVWERMGNAAEVMAVLTYGIPGMPLIYSGQEAGLDHRLLFFEKDEIIWKEHPFNILYTSLNKLKKDNPALWNPGFGGEMGIIKNSRPEQVLSFIRRKGENEVLYTLNLSPEAVKFTVEGFTQPLVFTDFFSLETTVFENPEIELPEWGYKIYFR